MNELTRIPSQNARMSSVDIADVMGKQHKNVIRDIKSLIDEGSITGLNFELSEYKDASGKSNPMYKLDFQATMTLITGYDSKRRAMIIDRWMKLETGEAEPALAPPQELRPLETNLRSAVNIAKLLGLNDNQAILSANRVIKRSHGVDCMKMFEATHLINPKQERLLTATELGNTLGISAQSANKLLVESGIIEPKRNHKNKVFYVPTEKGMPFCVLMDTGKHHNNGTPVQQLKFYESVKEPMANTGYKKSE